MIVKPESMTFAGKKVRILIAGFPGIGKTTLALSAPKPLYIDVDLSAERINREVLNLAAGVTQPRDYKELRQDLGMDCNDMELQAVRSNLADFETIVIDTGGKLLTIMGQYGRGIEPKYGQKDGSLSLKGYGWLGKEFQRFMDHIIYRLDKNIVIVFHTIEDKDGDDTKLRIKAEGSTKNAVWEVMDLGGFMEMRGNQRTIGFSNCERYFSLLPGESRGIKDYENVNLGAWRASTSGEINTGQLPAGASIRQVITAGGDRTQTILTQASSAETVTIVSGDPSISYNADGSKNYIFSAGSSGGMTVLSRTGDAYWRDGTQWYQISTAG